MHQLPINLISKFLVMEAVKQTVVPGGTGHGSSDLSSCYMAYSIIVFPSNFLCLVLFIDLLLLYFGQKEKNKMIHCCVSGYAGRSETISQLPYSQTTEEHMYGKPDRKPKRNLFLEVFFIKIARE